jgi:hypothetical protein
MKKQALTFIGVLSLLLVAGSAFAQTQKIRADVPFNFVVNGTMLPAGQYTVSNIGSGSSMLLIQSEDGRAAKLAAPHRVQSSEAANHTKLVFHCYAQDHCFLYQLWIGGTNSGQELSKSSLEKEVAVNRPSRNSTVLASIR